MRVEKGEENVEERGVERGKKGGEKKEEERGYKGERKDGRKGGRMRVDVCNGVEANDANGGVGWRKGVE